MKIIRPDLLYLGIVAAVPIRSKIARAQTPTCPKLTQILRKDLESQDQKVQETIVSVVDFGPGSAVPWHMHAGAQELPCAASLHWNTRVAEQIWPLVDLNTAYPGKRLKCRSP